MTASLKNEPWVTFCMTTYKRQEFLKKQITTLLKQSFGNFEIIISDNDPAASSKSIVESFNDPRIQYYTNEINLGMVKSFNRSLAKAKTEYVVMITDDDPVYPDMLQELYDLSLKYPGYGMYYGGCDIQCDTPSIARSSRLKVGTNSCLADFPIGEIRIYTGCEFAYAYFDGSLGCHILWSTGIVKKEVAMQIDGMPDFGAPYNTDFGYIVLSGSKRGTVLLNRSLGCQVVHGTNYGYTESDYEKFYITPDNFYKWVLERLPSNCISEKLKKNIEVFLGRWVVEYAVSIKKVLKENKKKDNNFEEHIRKIFKIPYIQPWKKKYVIATRFPNLFEIIVGVKRKMSKKNKNAKV